MNLVSLQFQTANNFEENLQRLVFLIDKSNPNSLILAPELSLCGYSYDNLEKAVDITNQAIPLLKALSKDKIIALTMTTKKDESYYNTLFIFHKGEIVHTQSKYKLFPLGDEEKYFTSGALDDIKVIEINGIKIATLICFELRFTPLWEKLKGADIILVPAMWGKIRKEHFETLTKALAITNQCYVIASDSSNDDMAKSSGIITPFGEECRDDNSESITQKFDRTLITKMRRYINIGIN
ncbi:MAG: carbon-nitrogen hydrolase family protein [Arcobacteraceae bacterium]|jgi:predicted amidohydrolase|nr:carbon-nitrogen hydrolase family protein [Arcobacteraceae bacterium]